MPTYYNKSRMSLSLPLVRGGSVLVPAKGTISVEPEDAGTLELRQLVERGFVCKLEDSVVAAPAPVVVVEVPHVAVVPVVAPVVAPAIAAPPIQEKEADALPADATVFEAATVGAEATNSPPSPSQPSAVVPPEDVLFRGKRRRG